MWLAYEHSYILSLCAIGTLITCSKLNNHYCSMQELCEQINPKDFYSKD